MTPSTSIKAVKAVKKYLATYAEPETPLLDDLFLLHPSLHPSLQEQPGQAPIDTPTFEHVLVIPAYRESRHFFDRLSNSLLQNHAVLLIVVINQPDTLIKPDLDNQRLWDGICKATGAVWEAKHIKLRAVPRTASAVLLVDRFSQLPLPSKQGVGLARKIGADLALFLINCKAVSQHWIYCTDADTHLPTDYFSALINQITEGAKPGATTTRTTASKTAAAVFPFRHLCDADQIGRATRLYEQRLQQYVDGLQAAGSPYGFHTLGSALAINAANYASVRGFPKRNGGEDFYLLNKAAKTGSILNLQGPEILIEARPSNRVPFGTGPAINRLLHEIALDEAQIFYHPRVFKHLQTWLEAMPQTWSKSINDLALPKSTVQALDKLGINKAIDSARRQSRSDETYIKHLHTWFDGFRTLRFIHLLRDGGLANVGLKVLTANPP